MSNAYWPIGEIKGEMYIGTGAGKKMLKEINEATHSIKIISPFISSNFIELLLEKADEGIEIGCVCEKITDEFSKDRVLSFQMRNKLVTATRCDLANIIEQKQTELKKYKVSLFVGLALIIFAIIFSITEIKMDKVLIPILFSEISNQDFISQDHINLYNVMMRTMLTIIAGFLCLMYSMFNKKSADKLKTYYYEYAFDFPINIIKHTSFDKYYPNHHLKLMIIDNKTAYFGSLNFTNSGCNNNVESIFKTNDTFSIFKLIECYSDIAKNAQSKIYSAQDIGEPFYNAEKKAAKKPFTFMAF